jgi:hypothetical protein
MCEPFARLREAIAPMCEPFARLREAIAPVREPFARLRKGHAGAWLLSFAGTTVIRG